MGMGETRTGNVRYMKQLTKLLQKNCKLDLIYYSSKQNINDHSDFLSQHFSTVHSVEAPPSYTSRPRGGEAGLSSINDWISRKLIDWCEVNVLSDRYDFIVCD